MTCRRSLPSFAPLLLAALALAAPSIASADSAGDFAGTYTATLPVRAEILNLHRDGSAEITLGAGSQRSTALG